MFQAVHWEAELESTLLNWILGIKDTSKNIKRRRN